MMSKKATVVLFVFIGASCTQAWQKDIWTEYGLQHQDQNSAEPLNLLGSITIQEGNVYITDPNSRNVYGSIVRQAEIVHSSPDDHEPSSVQSRTIIVPGGPDSRVIYYDYRKPSNANGGAIQSQQTNGRPELQYSTQQSYQDRQLYSAEAQGSQRRSTLPSNGVNGRNIPQPTNNYPYPYDRQAFYYSPSHQGHGPAAQQPNSYSSGQAYDRQKYLPSDRSNEPTVQQPPVPKANNNQGGASSLSNLGYGKANQHPQGYSSVPQAYNYGSQAHEPSTAGYGSYQPVIY